ncbi:MAG: hypothetical protein ACYC2I_13045 [Elusimicrobiales bacterium]
MNMREREYNPHLERAKSAKLEVASYDKTQKFAVIVIYTEK